MLASGVVCSRERGCAPAVRLVAAARDGDAAAEVRLDAVVDRLLTVASPALGEEMPPVVSSAAGTISQPYISDFGGHAVHS